MMRNNAKWQHGFTLIEVMMVIAIIGILVAIGIPNYERYAKRAARADAMVILLDAANKQEQFFVDNRQYTTDLEDIGVSATSENGYFSIAATVNNSTFVITATAQGGPVSSDTMCTTLTINELGLKGYTGLAKNADECWER
ncbi:prepilin-type N-terminal cleavage/methylation domain-containing protein [Pseudoalteromonas sp. MMG013]|uniref:type IV pilin protein n=1 Tax=unclassified Pseudoalteromonas TaxID=194690 RepID=UPI001B35E0D0|nr:MULTISPECIES: type IV pilin protein [unclassified Pseudoalteromonas]MBQ4845813.1 prepilin-type N-terminal cleavage/methylation domain-containing protein [Pseudoalteromonas sp. MMG005]MBQ4861763.1 prepilin-type N-terminal cleavage/methylation domain-containing protein [Pseudoalteromonas sp. MMG013]